MRGQTRKTADSVVRIEYFGVITRRV